MCFANNIQELDRFRAKKRSIKVWKWADVDIDTGLAITMYAGDKTFWEQGTIVLPDRIKKPLENGAYASSGLYFYTSEPEQPSHFSAKVPVIATVKPQDIIAVSSGMVICATAAKVTMAPCPNKAKMRIKFLKSKITESNVELKLRKQQIKEWESQQEENLEATQQMQDELEELKGKR